MNQLLKVIFSILFSLNCVNYQCAGVIFRKVTKSNTCRDANNNNNNSKHLRFGVLAPANDSLNYSLNKIMPAIIHAARQLENQSGNQRLIGNGEIEVLYSDTDCSSTYGPLRAVDFYVSGSVDVFLGPMCPYVLAPVARFSTVWNIPVITTAGHNDNFDHKLPHYKLLTRMNGSYSQIGLIFLQMLKKFGWKVVGFIYHNFDDRVLGNSNCYFTLAAVFSTLNHHSEYKQHRHFHMHFDETKSNRSNYEQILIEVSKNARSKCIDFLMFC